MCIYAFFYDLIASSKVDACFVVYFFMKFIFATKKKEKFFDVKHRELTKFGVVESHHQKR